MKNVTGINNEVCSECIYLKYGHDDNDNVGFRVYVALFLLHFSRSYMIFFAIYFNELV